MPTYKIRGVDVDFPYEAYDCQLVYMEKVIQSLQERCNALLESPTGTGKTLCLLCATLAWRKSLGGFSTCRREKRGRHMGSELSDEPLSQSESLNLPTILYASRTHSQLRQVIQELKRTSYRPKMVVLGSREQLCIHEDVSLLHGRTQTNACRSLCKKRKKQYCSHFPRVAEFMKDNPGLGDEPIDIEELVNIGKTCGPCPYYVSRELHKVADIMFAPYNYLIDRGYRKSLSVNWKDSILIFDEAHNLEGLCAEAASFDLSSWILTACISEAKNCIDIAMSRRDKSNDKSCNPDDFAILRALLLKLEKRIAEVPIESRELGFTKPGPYIYELLADLNITYKTATMLIGTIEEATLLIEEEANVADNEGPRKTKGMICRLESMADILKLIFRDGGTSHAGYYRFHVQEVEASATAAFKGKPSRTLSWWCFNPGLAMGGFSQLGVGSIILTSGTLSPLDSFAHEFKLEFPIRLENPHVISADQIWVGVVPSGPSGYAFNSSYRSRDLVEYKLELGNAIVNFARIVPDGLLVFFPSYYLMDQCIECWKNMTHINSTSLSTVWERICKHKQPVVESRQSSLFPLAIGDFMTKLKDLSTSGAVFFAVCRGKVSEGLDFADHAGRAVVITGMPFAMRTDPKVRLKREYLDTDTESQKMGSKVLTGEEWYSQQASRAVNQAVGRVIRHRHDYGAIIFCDERFAHPSRRSQISLWIQPHIKAYSKFGEVVFTLTRFFRDEATRGPTKLLDDGNASRLQTPPSLVKLHVEKIRAPPTTPMDSKFPSCISEFGDNSSRWGEIPPANRSMMSSYKKDQSSPMKYSGGCNEKILSIPRRKSLHHINHEKDLITNSSAEEETKEKLISLCSLEKPKIENLTQPIGNPPETSSIGREKPKNKSSVIHLVKYEKVHVPDYEGFQSAQMGSAELLRDKEITQKSKKNEVGAPSPAPCGDEERKGSAFLIQVREMLTDPEYGEFVACMKALKSKAMNIVQTLQSIVRIFSSPDRLPLLIRFKDYIPAKYHSLYDQYLKGNDAVEMCRQMTPIDSKLSVHVSPSISEVGDNPSCLGRSLPANSSTLPSNKKNQSLPVTYPTGLLCNEKILSIRRRKTIHHIDHEQDLATNSSTEEETKGKLISPCFLKKPKIENLTQPIENPPEPSSIRREEQQKNDTSVVHPVKHEKVLICDFEGFQSAQMGSTELLRDEVFTQKNQKNKVVAPSPTPCGDEERKGSAFLIQVREKLTDPEYVEFVSCMKALKSKTMKIGQALQSIVRIFSSPDRLPLLLRFKDYIPAKFHSLYEQCLKRSDDAIEM